MTIKIRKISKEDYQGIVDLYNKYFLNKIDFIDRKNLYDLNPLYANDRNKYTQGFIALENSNIIGHIAAIPLEFIINKKKITAYSTNALIAEDKYRLIAPILCKKFSNLDDVDFLINLTANHKASILFKNLGFKTFKNKKNYFNNYFIVNNKFLLNRIKNKLSFKNVFIYTISNLYIFFINFFINFYDTLFSLNKYKLEVSKSFEKINFDEKKDLTSNVNFIQVSSIKWHIWKYHKPKKNNNYVNLKINKNKLNVAQAILVFYPNLNKVRVSELYINNEVKISSIMVLIIKFIKKKNFDILEFKINSDLDNHFLKLFKITKNYKFNSNLYKINAKEKFDSNILKEFDNFVSYYSYGDKIV